MTRGGGQAEDGRTIGSVNTSIRLRLRRKGRQWGEEEADTEESLEGREAKISSSL